jgi:hypothetical protein
MNCEDLIMKLTDKFENFLKEMKNDLVSTNEFFKHKNQIVQLS